MRHSLSQISCITFAFLVSGPNCCFAESPSINVPVIPFSNFSNNVPPNSSQPPKNSSLVSINTSKTFVRQTGVSATLYSSLPSGTWINSTSLSNPTTLKNSETLSSAPLRTGNGTLLNPGTSSKTDTQSTSLLQTQTTSKAPGISSSSYSTGPSPSSSATLPFSTASKPWSTSLRSTSSVAPINQQPVISTIITVVSGTTQLVPVIFGGAFETPVPVVTTAPPTTILATGKDASSSASALSSKVNFLILPLIKGWTDKPEKDKSDAAIVGIKGILPEAVNLLKSLGGDGSKSPCSGTKKRDLILVAKGIPNPFKIAADIIHSVACITNTLNKVIGGIQGGIEGGIEAVKGVLSDIDDLKSLTKLLHKEVKDEEGNDDDDDDEDDNDEESKSESKTSASKTSASSCSQTSVTQNLYVKCFPQTITGSTSQVTQTCTTKTSTISGCSISALTTTATASGRVDFATKFVTLDIDQPVSAEPVNFSLFSSRLAFVEASGRYGNITGSGKTTVNSTTSTSTSLKLTSTSSGILTSSTSQTLPSRTSPTSSPQPTSTKQPEPPPSTTTSKPLTLPITQVVSLPKTSVTVPPPQPTPPPPPPPPFKSGLCQVNIYEQVTDGDKNTPIMAVIEVKDASGNDKGAKIIRPDGSLKWDGKVTFPQSDTKLPYPVVVTFTRASPKKRSLRGDESAKFKRLQGNPPTAKKPDYTFEKWLVVLEAGPVTFDSGQTDKNKMPHWNVGNWDNNASPPTRKLDAFWAC